MATIVVQQPCHNNTIMIGTIEGQRGWSTGIFDCFSDCSNCLFTLCCYSCAVSKLASRTGECRCTPCFIIGSDVAIRARIRTLGGIRGTLCGDCVTLWCCGPCAICQMARELDMMGVS